MIEARDVSIFRGGGALLGGVSMTLETGRLTIVIGPNGAGKSTLLRTLSGEWRPDAGAVLLDGAPMARFSAGALAARRAVVSQASALAFPFSALEVAMLGASVPGFGLDDREARRVAMAMLDRLGLGEIAARPYTVLSGGERQRAQIARALTQLACGRGSPGTARALLLDEPTASLDIGQQRRVLEEARRAASEGLAVFAVLHDLNLAAACADVIHVLRAGRVVASGTPDEVIREDVLSAAYGAPVRANRLPRRAPFALPHAD